MNQIRKEYNKSLTYIFVIQCIIEYHCYLKNQPSHKILETHTYSHMLHVSSPLSKKKVSIPVFLSRFNITSTNNIFRIHRSTPISTRIYRRTNPSERGHGLARRKKKRKKEKEKEESNRRGETVNVTRSGRKRINILWANGL